MSDLPQSEDLRPSRIPGCQVFWGYDDLVLLGGALLPSIVAGMLLGSLAQRVLAIERGVASFILLFTAYSGWFASLYLLFRLRYQKPFWESLGWRALPWRFPAAAMAGMAVAVALIFVSAFLPRPPVDSPMQELLRNENTLILVGIFSTTLGPLCEELAFRGFLLPLFAQTFGVAAGIVLAAVPFAVAHAPQYAYSWRHVALIGLAGIAFGWIRFKTGSTASAVVMHSAYNLIIFAGLVYERYQW
jgi:uncharacterized protein